MDRRVVAAWIVLAAVAAAAAGMALHHGSGTVDVPTPPPPPPPVDRNPVPAATRRKLPYPRFPASFPAPAAAAVKEAWPEIESGSPERAAAGLVALTPVAAESPLASCAPAALEGLAPALEILITDHPEVAVPAMRCAAALARTGGAEGRAALQRTGLVTMAFARLAIAGSPSLQVETALLLGYAGGDQAQQVLVLLLAPGKPPEVRAAAATGLGEAFPLEHRLRADAIAGVLAAAADGEPPILRREALRTIDRAWEAFRPYEPGPVAAAGLAPGDRGVRLAAATFFWNHPLTAQGPALVEAVPYSDTEVLVLLAESLSGSGMQPQGWREALEKRLPQITDPETIKAVRKALGR